MDTQNAAQQFIDVLKAQVQEIDEQINPLLEKRKVKASLANATAADAGLPVPFPDAGSETMLPAATTTVETVAPDQYTGKKLATVVREILQRRKNRGQTAISLDDLFNQLRTGGYDFGTKDTTNAITSLSTTLGKNVIFRRVPNNPKLWGLAEWYGGPNKRKAAGNDDEDDAGDTTPPVATTPKAPAAVVPGA